MTDDEIANPDEVKACQAFDAAVSAKLGAAMSKHDLSSDDIDADTPTFVPYEDEETIPSQLPDIDDVTPEAADSYVGAQVNLPIGGTTSEGTVKRRARDTNGNDRIPSTTPGAEPPRDARDSGSARSHSTHLETSSSDRPKWSPTRSSTRYQDQISVTCTRWTLRMPSFTRATHAQPSLSNFTRRDSNFGERTRSRGTTLGEQNFPTSPQNKKTKLTHCSIYVPMRTISTSHAK